MNNDSGWRNLDTWQKTPYHPGGDPGRVVWEVGTPTPYTPPLYRAAYPGAPVSQSEPPSVRRFFQVVFGIGWAAAIWFVVRILQDALNDPAIHKMHLDQPEWMRYGLCLTSSILFLLVAKGNLARWSIAAVTVGFAIALTVIA